MAAAPPEVAEVAGGAAAEAEVAVAAVGAQPPVAGAAAEALPGPTPLQR